VSPRKRNTRYPHAFSKGQGVRFTPQGSWRPQAPCTIQTQALGQALGQARAQAAEGDSAKRRAQAAEGDSAKRMKYLRVSPTVADLYRSHAGLAVICADCLHGVGHRNPGLPDRYRRQWGLTLLELEKRCRCGMCGSRNARVYPWWGEGGGAERGLQAAVGDGR
jgi:hypothetical protein